MFCIWYLITFFANWWDLHSVTSTPLTFSEVAAAASATESESAGNSQVALLSIEVQTTTLNIVSCKAL